MTTFASAAATGCLYGSPMVGDSTNFYHLLQLTATSFPPSLTLCAQSGAAQATQATQALFSLCLKPVAREPVAAMIFCDWY